MVRFIKNLFRWAKGLDYRLKFLFVGGLNTAVGLGSYWLILICFGVNIVKDKDAALYIVMIATIISQIIGVIHSFFWNKFFTFESKKKSRWEAVRFVCVYAIAFGIDYLLKWLLTDMAAINQIFVAIIVVFITMIISFVGMKFFVFKHRKQPKTPEPEAAACEETANL